MPRTHWLPLETVGSNYRPSMGPDTYKALGAQVFLGGQAMLPCSFLLLLNQDAVAYDLPGEFRRSVTAASVSTSVDKNCLLAF